MLPKGQEFFSLNELLLLAVFGANAVTLVTAVATLLPGGFPSRSPLARRARLARTLALLRNLAIADGVYFALVLLTTLQRPDPIQPPRLGDPLCLGHRCITVEEVTREAPAADTRRASGAPAVTYVVTLRLSNSSRYAAPDALSGVYLVDDRGRRYAPVADGTERSLTARLEPNMALTTTRRFTLPADARHAGFVVERGGGGPSFRCLIVGGSCWHAALPQPPVVLE